MNKYILLALLLFGCSTSPKLIHDPLILDTVVNIEKMTEEQKAYLRTKKACVDDKCEKMIDNPGDIPNKVARNYNRFEERLEAIKEIIDKHNQEHEK